MKITDILSPEVIEINIEVNNKIDALSKIVNIAARSNNILDIQRVTGSIIEIEEQTSTGMGNGFAIPYLRTNYISHITAAFAITKEPIEFDSKDGIPVRFIFILLGKRTDTNTLIGLLSHVSHMFHNEGFRKKLLEARSKNDILKIFEEQEKK